MNFGVLTEKQVLFLKSSLQKKLKTLVNSKAVKVKFLLPLNLNLTSLGLESRMGKGKGTISSKLSIIKPGQIILIFSGVSYHHITLIINFLKNRMHFEIKLTSIKY